MPPPLRPTSQRLRLATHAGVLALALAVPFADSAPQANTQSPDRPAAVLGHLRVLSRTAEDPPGQATDATPPIRRPTSRKRVLRRPVPPVVRPASGPVSSPFGWRRHPVSGRSRHHDGADLAVPLGSTVRAVASGVVRSVSRRSGYGLVVEIEHRPTPGHAQFRTLYAHLSGADRRLRQGSRVGRGQPVGASGGVPGRDGTSTGPHLHFEVRDASGRALDPAPFLGTAVPRQTTDEQRWQVMFSSGRKPLTAQQARRPRRPTRAAFALPLPAGSRGRARRLR
jgi:murein DD-endopeptidase MepM/ murein hydrolase activator NlpD